MRRQWKQCQTLFFWGGSKITADGDCSHEIKRHLLLGRKVMTNLDSILKSRDITLPTKVRLAKAMVFPVIMYGCESWTGKKAERRRIDAFELWCWRRLLRVPWTASRSNQFILKEISPECSLEGLMLKLKLQYFGHLMQRADSLEKTLMLGGTGGRRKGDDRGWDDWMASLTRWTWVWLDSGSRWWTGRPGVLRFMGSQRVGHNWATELNWIEPHFRLLFCLSWLLHGSRSYYTSESLHILSDHPISSLKHVHEINMAMTLHRRGSHSAKILVAPLTVPGSGIGLVCSSKTQVHKGSMKEWTQRQGEGSQIPHTGWARSPVCYLGEVLRHAPVRGALPAQLRNLDGLPRPASVSALCTVIDWSFKKLRTHVILGIPFKNFFSKLFLEW